METESLYKQVAEDAYWARKQEPSTSPKSVPEFHAIDRNSVIIMSYP